MTRLAPLVLALPLLLPVRGIVGQTPAAARRGIGLPDAMPGPTVGSVGRVTFTYRGQPVTYATVRAEDGKVWLRQNLGSARVAESPDDDQAQGDLFQFGRWDDGHAVRSPDNTRRYPNDPRESDPTRFPTNPAEVAASPRPVPFMYGLRQWWPKPARGDQWTAARPADATATNGVDPCRAIGAGWRLPTAADFEALTKVTVTTNRRAAFLTAPRFSVARARMHMNGMVDNAGAIWTSTVTASGRALAFDGGEVGPVERGLGLSVRCLYDEAMSADGAANAGTASGATGAPGVRGPATRGAASSAANSGTVYRMGGEVGDVRLEKRDTVNFDGGTAVPIVAAGGYVVISLPSTTPARRPFYVTWVRVDENGRPTSIATGMAREVQNSPKGTALKAGQWMFSAPESPGGVQWMVKPRAAAGGAQPMIVDYNPIR